jgi:hypothetical protein
VVEFRELNHIREVHSRVHKAQDMVNVLCESSIRKAGLNAHLTSSSKHQIIDSVSYSTGIMGMNTNVSSSA